jgi:hypothetical protein
MNDNNELKEESTELANNIFNNYNSVGAPLTAEAMANAVSSLNTTVVAGANQRNAEGLIDRLTPEQEAKIPEYVARFQKLGLNTDPCDRPKAEQVVRDIYNHMGKDGTNLKFVWADSPFVGAVMAAKALKQSDDVTTSEIRDQASMASYGSFEAYWAALYSFISNELPVKPHPLYSLTTRMVEECGVFWTFDELAIMTDRPSEIHLKEDRLHNETGYALKYRDGRGMYVLEGDRKGSLLELKLAVREKTSSQEDT